MGLDMTDEGGQEQREASEAVQTLRQAFRHHLETFYARLQLAPPYHSVEKALTHLTSTLMAMSPDERTRLAGNPARHWPLFGRIFVESGLAQKHRGIIVGLVRDGRTGNLPPEYATFLEVFRS